MMRGFCLFIGGDLEAHLLAFQQVPAGNELTLTFALLIDHGLVLGERALGGV